MNKPSLLAVCSEKILPPQSGGSLRSVGLLHGLSRYFDIYALLPQDSLSISLALANNQHLQGLNWIGISDHPAYVGLSYRQRFRLAYWRWREKRQISRWRQLPWEWFLGAHHSWKQVLLSLSKSLSPDYFLVDHTRNVEIFSYAKHLWPHVQLVCNSHNVESCLLRQLNNRELLSESLLLKYEAYEKKYLEKADYLWTCSTDDMLKYRSAGVKTKNSAVVPNGVDTSVVKFNSAPTKSTTIIFVGNLAYQPNIEGVLWFYREVWPRLKVKYPKLCWQLVGSWADPVITQLSDPSISVNINVPSVMPYLEKSKIAICPIFSGSGTRLKILESFSAGVPVVSTTIGAEGLDVSDHEHLLIADTADHFIQSIASLLDDAELVNSIRTSARNLVVQQYDWKSISDVAAMHLLGR